MNKIKTTTIAFIILLTAVFAGSTAGINADGAVSIYPSARALGMGEAYGSVGDDIQTMFFNPAGLGLLHHPEISASYFEFVEGVRFLDGAYAYHLGKPGTIAAEVGVLMTGGVADIVDYTDTGSTLGALDLLAQIGYGVSPLKNLHLGASTRFYLQNHFEESGVSINFNAGVLLTFQALSIGEYQRRNLGIGLSIQNAGTAVKIGSAKNKMPLNIKTGLFYKPRSVVCLAFDFNYMIKTGPHFNLGLEVMPDWYVTPRIGYKFGLEGNESLTAGLGFHLRRDPVKINVDYAILPMLDMGMQHSVTISFNHSVKKTFEEIEDEKLKQEYTDKKKAEKVAELKKQREELQSGMSVAVNDFTAKGVSEVEAVMVSDYLRTFLVKTKKFRVIDKANMEMILGEQEFQASGCTDAECAVQIGQLLGARLIITGSFGEMMKTYIININVADVETSQIFFSDTVKCKSFGDIESAVEELADQIAQKAEIFKE